MPKRCESLKMPKKIEFNKYNYMSIINIKIIRIIII